MAGRWRHWLFLLLMWAVASPVTSNESPNFVGFRANLFLAEDIPIGTVITVLRGVDPDDTVLSFSIDGDIGNTLLHLERVDDTSANVTLSTPLDKESQDHYNVEFRVSDGENSIPRTANLYITDVNDNAPSFVGLPYRAEVWEDTALDVSLFQVSATDPDTGIFGLTSYTISTPQGFFTVEQGSGIVKLHHPLDYETEKFIQLEIMATDGGGLNSTTDLVITVLDVQDTAPYFLNLPYMGSVVEDALVGTSVIQVTALDGDQGVPNDVEFSIIEGNTQYFSLDGITGIVTVAEPLDREDPAIRDMFGIIDLTIQASELTSDPQGPTTATALVTIAIQDINDQSPTFNQPSYQASVFENTQARIPITFLPDGTEMVVHDYDQGDMGRFELVLEKNGLPYDVFEVVPSLVFNEATVLLRVLDTTALDYESTQSLEFQIVAREHLTPEAHESQADVTVTILDMNDNWPTFEDDIYGVSIPENSPRGTSIIQITATDSDSGTFGDISYNIRGSSADLFSIDSSTGEILVNADADLDHSLLDRETVDTHYLTLVAVDGGGLRSLVQVVISLTDVNDNAPSIARSEYEGYVDENAAQLDRSLIVQAIDLDLPPNSDITYEITPGEYSDHFVINATSGEVSLSTPLDYEDVASSLNGQLELLVVAKDDGTPSLNGSTLVLIYLEDVNDEIPVFNETSYSAVLPENTQVGSYVVHIYATDNDGTVPNNEIIYRIDSGARDKFRIDGQTGLITVESGADLDRDVYGSSYMLSVLAIDRGTPPNTAATTVSVTVTDINNQEPVFSPPTVIISLPENSGVGTEVYTYTATDTDNDAELTYSLMDDLVEGEDEDQHPVTDTAYLQGLFAIHSNNGTVYVQSSLDRESVEEVILVVKVEDIHAQDPAIQTATARLTVILSDVNDNPPEFIPSPAYLARISEASQPGIEVKQVFAVDQDEGSSSIQYYLNYTSAQSEAFEISDPSSGLVTLLQQVDREQSESVTLVVRAEDVGTATLTGYATIEVSIEDVNDNSPEWSVFPAEVSVWENATLDSIITAVEATDLDTNEFGRVMYYLTSGNTGTFTLDTITGELRLTGQIDHEITNEYKLTIEARDNNLASTNEQRRTPGYMTVYILDINDSPPVFDEASYTASSVLENSAEGTQILTVHASDADSGDNSVLTYTIDSAHSNASQLFDVQESSGIVSVAQALRGNVGWFYITVLATDNGIPAQSSSTQVFVFIVDVNDHQPQIIQPEVDAIIPVQENVAPGTMVTQVIATDEDEGLNGEIRYEYVENPALPDWDKFHLNTTSGIITTTQEIDREDQEDFYMEVRAYDLGNPSYYDSRSIHIRAQDEDDNPPVFPEGSSPLELSVREETDSAYIGTVNMAEDPDTGNNSMVCYYLVGNSPYLSDFYLNKTQGALYLRNALDHEDVEDVQILIKASDDCGSGIWENPANTETITWDPDDHSLLQVVVAISDINDNGPQFTKRWFTAGVTRDTQLDEVVIKLQEYVLDLDGPSNQQRQFYLTLPIIITGDELRNELANREVFVVDPNKGTVMTNSYFSESMHGYFTLNLVVNDSVAGHQDTAEASIYLLNEDQRAKVVVWGTPQEVSEFKDEFAEYLSNTTGFVINVDRIQTHRDRTDSPDERKTDMFIHAIDPRTGEVLDATLLLDLIDRNYDSLKTLFTEYDVIEIVLAIQVSTAVEENIQLALTFVAALLFILLIIVCATFFTCRKKYKRKLKAATAMAFDTSSSVNLGNGFMMNSSRTLTTLNGSNGGPGLNHIEVPGTNIHAYEGSNPIWLEQSENGWAGESDTESKNSLDENALGSAGRTKSYDEQEASLEMFNDEYDHFNQLPAKEADIYLTAALSHRDHYRQMNGSRQLNGKVNGSAGNLSHTESANRMNLGGDGEHDNLGFQPDGNGDILLGRMNASKI